ncbi:MAG: ATP-binding protein [Myxococcaceae bacterium]
MRILEPTDRFHRPELPNGDRGRLLYAVTAALNDAVSEEQITTIVLDVAIDAMGATAGGVAVVDRDRSVVRLVRTRGYPEEHVTPFVELPLDSPIPLCRTITTGSPCWLESAETAAKELPGEDSKGLSVTGTRVVLPLTAGGKALGAVALSFADWREFAPEDRAFLLSIARQCGAALDRARLYEDAKALARSREELLAIVAHDLRTPLGAIGAATRLLQTTAAEGAAKERYLGNIDRAAKRMATLITDLLELARIQSGSVTLSKKSVRADELMQTAREQSAAQASQKGITLSVESELGDVSVLCDQERVLQIFSNLISNALKFTPGDGVVSIEASASERDVTFVISDTGPGIARDHLPRLFTRYWQADPGNRHGVGLGLSIVKAIVDAHGGSVRVQSEPGEGTRFFFTLPRG